MYLRAAVGTGIAGVMLIAAGCGGSETAPGEAGASATPTATAGISATAVATATALPQPERQADGTYGALTEPEQRLADRLAVSFPQTVFAKRTVPLTDLLDGGVGRDEGIPSIRSPLFVDSANASEWLADDEPVVSLAIDGEARAYPIQILMWHEVVNDTLAGVPVVVTFCPLCNTALAFDRRVNGEARVFGVSGLLRRSDLVMVDDANDSLWQQITGEAIVGADVAAQLAFVPAQIVAWSDFRETYPDGLVLSRETGFVRDYGQNPYAGYDRVGSGTLFPVAGADDPRLDAKERVLAVEIAGDAVAFPFSEFQASAVLTAEVAGTQVVAFWQPGALSPLDASMIIGGRNIGAAGAFLPVVDGRALEFEQDANGRIVDLATGSVWNVLGRAIEGELAGAELTPVSSANHFWFAWVVFKPETRVIRGGG